MPESHTADARLGFVSSHHNNDGAPDWCDDLLSSSLATRDRHSLEEVLDRNTTLSKSFRSSSFHQSSSPFQPDQHQASVSPNPGTSFRDNDDERDKMSQVRVLTSPPASEHQNLGATSASRTPTTARINSRGRTKNLTNNGSRRSLKSIFSKNKKHNTVDNNNVDDAPVATSETNLDTTIDDDVFLASKQGVIVTVESDNKREGGGRTKDWTDSRKQRKVGSPGRTGNAEFFIRHVPLRSFDIDIGAQDDRVVKTDVVKKSRKNLDSRNAATAPQHQVYSRTSDRGARPKETFLRPPSLRKRSRHRVYKPGYSESEEQTDFTSDEERRERRGRLELAVTRPGSSPGSSCADTSVTPPPPASTDVSPDPSPLASYSHQSFTQSEMELVASPSVK